MPQHRILLSNLGYARGINGSAMHHLRFAYRHAWHFPRTQKKILNAFRCIVDELDPELCCLLEIDTGSSTSAGVNQLELLRGGRYEFCEAENKYHPDNPLRRLPVTRGKSNALLAKQPHRFEKIYFTHGTKRLVYKVWVEAHCLLYFTHFSLNKKIRRRQVLEMAALAHAEQEEVMILGDFNVLTGLEEIQPLLRDGRLRLINDHTLPTFTFAHRKLTLDLCLCTPALAERTKVHIVPQPFSDHSALLVSIDY